MRQQYQEMSSPPKGDLSQNRQRDQKRTRRTRKDEEGRDFFCQCGKSYLSYPALYTHVKTKHDGKPPQKSNVQHDEKSPLKEDLEQLKMFLSRYYPERIRATPIQALLEGLEQEQKDYVEPLLKYWEERQINKQKYGVERKELICANLIFGKFLYNMNKRVNTSCMHFLIRLIIYLRDGVCKQKNNPNYCQECTAAYIPSLFKELILNDHIPIGGGSPDRIMDDVGAVCRVLQFFAGWLFNQQYSNYAVKYRG